MMSLNEVRGEVLDNRELTGTPLCKALADAVDGWLVQLFDRSIGDRTGVALVAVGGYGRAELAPHSDLDVLLVHDLSDEIEDLASKLWYPLWDEGAKLGYSVRTIPEAIELARSDLDTATSLLTIRHLAGDNELTRKLASSARTVWRKQAKTWLPRLEESAAHRHERSGEVAFMLEPALKNGRGGLRDVHMLRWAGLTERGHGSLEETGLLEAHETILRARVELHRVSGRAGDALLLEQQDAVAAALDYEDADALMADVAGAGRAIAWHADEVMTQMIDGLRRRLPKLRRSAVVVGGPGVTVTDRRVHLEANAEVTAEAVLRLTAAAAHHDARLAPTTIDRLQGATIEVQTPWSPELRKLFVDVFKAGHRAIPVVETIDQLGLFVPFIPEWAPNRSRPQRNAYHRFTVDRHLWETAAEAASLVDQVTRPDLLLVGALLHDIGKGYPGDHTVVGMELIPTIAGRMGFSQADIAVLVAMCEHHLLLPDVATRRNLDDDDTIHGVADAAGSVEVLQLLRALTEADSIATGPSAWSSWKKQLVRDLANRAEFVLEGGDAGELPRNFPTEEQRTAMRRGTQAIHGEGGLLTVYAPDRPGMFSRVAGAVTLNGLEVIEAAAHTEFGLALAMFQVQPRFVDTIDWAKVSESVGEALNGRLALAARIDEQIRIYSPSQPSLAPQRVVQTRVTIDNESSSTATIVEVASANGIGLLYYVTRAFSQLDLNIATAKVQTLGDDVVDSFYLRDQNGDKVVDESYLAEIQRALDHALLVAFLPQETLHG